MKATLTERHEAAETLVRTAGALALDYFRSLEKLEVEKKGRQDLVSDADRNVELHIRERLGELFPDDGIVGEEHDDVPSQTGFTWVIDPIDGTANFVRGIPAWCVVLACVKDDTIEIGVIYDPCHNELYSCQRSGGAYLNNAPMKVAETEGLDDGSVGVGMNNRTPGHMVTRFIELLAERHGIFYRNASGALMLAYVAAGRLIGYAEPHMNAWDCLAGQLLIAEAGGRIETQDARSMLKNGGRVVAGSPAIFNQLVDMSDDAFVT